MTQRMTIKPIDDGDLLYIVRNMRAEDREEIFATRWASSPNFLVDDCMGAAALPTSHTAMMGLERPIAVIGAMEPWPGCWDVWMFATDEFPRIAFSMTKYVRKTFIPALLERGMRRAHCRSIATHTKNHAWLRENGARLEHERVLKSWGKDGQDFLMFTWFRDDLLAMMKKSEAA